MVRVKKFLCFLVAILVMLSCVSEISYARRQPRGSYYWRKHYYDIPYATQKRYRYIKTHDLNKDGRVDNQDRLLWTNKYGKDFFPIDVTRTNADIYEVMDLNDDGKVTKKEFKEFHNTFDINRNGVIERSEVDEAMYYEEEFRLRSF